MQATSQISKRYGPEGMQELRDVFPAVLCLTGAAEKEMFGKAAWWYAQSDRQKTSTDHHGRQSQSAEKSDAMVTTDLLPRSTNEGRVLGGKRPGDESSGIHEAGLHVQLLDISNIKIQARQ